MKKIFNLVGFVITLASVYFLYGKYQDLNGTINSITDSHLATYFWMPFIYAWSAMFLALAWGNIISNLDYKLPVKSYLAIYGISQIGKYIPGNIFHYVGKQFLGVAYGIPAKKLAKSQLYEIFLQLLSALGFAVFIGYSCLFNEHGIYAFSLMALSNFIIYLTVYFFKKKTIISLFFYMIFLCVLGGLFAVVLKIVSHFDYDAESFFYIISAFSTAWLIGFVIPGAPAGIGVRETVLIFLLSPSGLAEHDVFTSAILFRIISVCGDFIFFFFGSFLFFLKKD
ncbi:hypothetical protein ABU178_12505 [Pantoea osteomyelitidis]|uniref:Uncharacterized protein n=1 Tax=Pantoea osteomyelitidis TaxID=3230026 RepID=A0ABW7PXD1_9GAMM